MAGESHEEGNIDDVDEIYMNFYEALQQGSWTDAGRLLYFHPNAIGAKIAVTGNSALRVAAEAGQVGIVEELVKLMPEENLETKDFGFSALAWAASNGNFRMTQCMLGTNANLLTIRNNFGTIPVVLALKNGHLDLARYIYLHTPSEILLAERSSIAATVVSEAIYNNAFQNIFFQRRMQSQG